jgi:predicted ATPase
MIKRVKLSKFKRFADQKFELEDSIILAGPNNAGKSTLLQAIATWKLGFDRWMAQRKGGKAVKRTGVPITRAEFTAVPLREMNLLWEDRRVSGDGAKPGTPRLIEIVLEGDTEGVNWQCGLEFQYANPELIYVRPCNAKSLTQEEMQDFPPLQAAELDVVHVPPLSGIERDEPRRDRGMQDLLIGQGRPGEILRNLLWEIAQKKEEDWQALTKHMRDLFRIDILKPSYSPVQPFIVCEYKEPGHDRPLDLSNAGSGTLQVLLLLAFLYARSASVILLDEPDAHQHVILQKQVYDLIRKAAHERGGQVIIATHSEVVLDATEPARVLGFFGGAPRPLASETERDQLREALKRITTTDLLLGYDVGAVLYVESEDDEKILREWARILNHPASEFLEKPYVHWLKGRSLAEARGHFFALRAVFPEIHGLVLLDGDNRDQPDEETTKIGLVVLRWRRYEIENYLLQPEAIKRFINFPLMENRIEQFFWEQVPKGTDLFSDHVSLVRIKASDEFLSRLFVDIDRPQSKRDLYLLASKMKSEELHPEIIEKLDRIAEVLNPRKTEIKDSIS